MINVANLVTLSRLAIIPVLIYSIQQEIYLLSGFLVLSALVSDWLDGIIARKTNEVTQHGKLLDPAIDKIFIISVLVAFVEKHYINSYPVFLIVTREFLVTWLRSVMVNKGIVIPAFFLGKLKTTFQLLAVFLLSIGYITIGAVVLWISIIMAYVSAIQYFQIFYKNRAWA
ncbi:MAG: CDP-diacylglycerol--glycerol-3-phosphate 3-phosphatidyltransferase [Aquificae bacterium]|nr:CDP-diacylglycerol--glycerol-3-phosphate 3-phosphatidyltransferase [Aquificota bacterium]